MRLTWTLVLTRSMGWTMAIPIEPAMPPLMKGLHTPHTPSGAMVSVAQLRVPGVWGGELAAAWAAGVMAVVLW